MTHLNELWLQDFRCFENLELFFSEGLNWIHGNNGSGKTSILEAVYWSGRARSFRTSQSKSLISHNKTKAITRLRFDQKYLSSVIDRKEPLSFRYNQEPLKRTSELGQHIAVQFLGPQSHKLVEPEPETRRLWLDWSLFHVKHNYLTNYQNLKRGLTQRNHALRSKQSQQLITAFDTAIVQLAIELEQARAGFVGLLNTTLIDIKQSFELDFDFKLSYQSSIPVTADNYLLLLQQYLVADRERGFTWHSPFRSKLLISSNATNASHVLSRGQQKLTAFILLLAQQQILTTQSNKASILLVDDLHAELDSSNRYRLSEYLNQTGQQVLITSTEKPDKGMQSAQMFHVEQAKLVHA